MTSKWGPIYWNYIHMITLKYPTNPTKKERETHYYLIHNFMQTLPCNTCQKEIKKLITNKELQLVLENRTKFVEYLWSIHNKVNKRLNKKEISFNKFKSLYKFNYSSNLFKIFKYSHIKTAIICLLIVIIIGLLLNKYR